MTSLEIKKDFAGNVYFTDPAVQRLVLGVMIFPEPAERDAICRLIGAIGTRERPAGQVLREAIESLPTIPRPKGMNSSLTYAQFMGHRIAYQSGAEFDGYRWWTAYRCSSDPVLVACGTAHPGDTWLYYAKGFGDEVVWLSHGQ